MTTLQSEAGTLPLFHLTLPRVRFWGWEGRAKRAVMRFFKDFRSTEEPPPKKFVLRVMYPHLVTSAFLLDVLNHFGVYGWHGGVKRYIELRFSLPTVTDQSVKRTLEEDTFSTGGMSQSDFEWYMHDAGARGRRRIAREMGWHIYCTCYFVAEAVDLRQLYVSTGAQASLD